MPVEGAAERYAHFARNHLPWIVVRHFLPADLLEELGHAIVGAASRGRIDFAAIFDTARSGGPSALASWAVRPRPTGSAFEAYLQRLVMRLVWQGDQTAGWSDRVVDPNELAAMEVLEVALAVSPVDFESVAYLSTRAAKAPGALQVLVSAVAELSRLAPGAQGPDLEPVLAGGVLEFEGPLDAVAVKFLGDLCADADEWEAASSRYERAGGLISAVVGPAWAGFTHALQAVLAQSRAAAAGALEGPAAASGILDELMELETLGTNLLGLVNAVPDQMTARSNSENIFFVEDTRAAVILTPQLMNAHDLASAYAGWLEGDYDEAHRLFWATLRRQTALGSAIYSRHTKAAYGRSLIDSAQARLGQERQPQRFDLGVRMLLESGRASSVEKTSWTERLIQEYVDEGRVTSTLAHAHRAPGTTRERTMVALALFKHWVQGLPPGAPDVARSMILVLVEAAKKAEWSIVSDRNLAGAAFEGLAKIAEARPEFRSLAAGAVADALVARIEEAAFLPVSAALELAHSFLEAFEDGALVRLGSAILGLLARFEPSNAPWPVVRPAIAFLASEQVLSLCRRNERLASTVPAALVEFALGSQTEQASLMYLLRDLDPNWIGQVDASRLRNVVTELRRRAGEISSSRAADDILALLVAPAFSEAEGVRDALQALHAVLSSAAAGTPSISFSRAYLPLMEITKNRETVTAATSMPVDDITAILGGLLTTLLGVWARATTAPSIFAGFAIPPRTKPNPTLVHNWTFASISLARALDQEAAMVEALDVASLQSELEAPISLARALRVTAGDPETFDAERIRGETREAFYAALGQRLVLLGALPHAAGEHAAELLLEQCFRLGPRGLDAGVFAVACNLVSFPTTSSAEAEAYRRRLDNHPDIRLSLAPMYDNLKRKASARP